MCCRVHIKRVCSDQLASRQHSYTAECVVNVCLDLCCRLLEHDAELNDKGDHAFAQLVQEVLDYKVRSSSA